MPNINKNATILFFTGLITLLFYKQPFGLNLILFEAIFLGYLFTFEKIKLNTTNSLFSFGAVLITVFFTVYHHTLISYISNFLIFLLFLGVIIAPEVKSIINSLSLGFSNIIMAQRNIKLIHAGDKERSRPFKAVFKRFRIFFLPVIIILVFILIYSWSSPKFAEITGAITDFINEKISFILEYIEFSFFLMIIVSFLISVFLILRARNNTIIENDQKSTDELKRYRIKHNCSFGMTDLKNEYRSAVFLFVALNIIILVLNITDINSVWFNFEWEGQFLKQFVHHGTYLLIFAILISIIIVLYFFRGNLNFFSKIKLIRTLSYIWIAQNVILTISVLIRNLYYIDHFALAYKRIAVMFFLLLTIYGLYTVFQKVKGKKTSYYLIRKNSFAWIIALVVATGFNWDVIIARYNFRHSETAFVHLNFLGRLSDNALHELDQPIERLNTIRVEQRKKYSGSSSGSFKLFDRVYDTPEEYFNRIGSRKRAFKQRYETQGILSWNYAEYKTYHALFDK